MAACLQPPTRVTMQLCVAPIALGLGVAIYLFGLGFLGGLVAERVRFDQRRIAMLQRYNEALRRTHQHLMSLEQGRITEGASRPLRSAEAGHADRAPGP